MSIDCSNRIIRNQIDFILISDRFKNNITDVKTKPGADMGSDHNLLVASICMKLKKITPCTKIRNMQLEELTEITKRQIFNDEVTKSIHSTQEESSVNSWWNQFKNAILKSAKSCLSERTLDKKQDWMTDQILQLMRERKEYKNTNSQLYKEVQAKINRKIKIAKKNWMTEKCKDIETCAAF